MIDYNDNLSACPFCGGRAYIEEVPVEYKRMATQPFGYMVMCEDCYAKMGLFKTKETAIMSWNRRDAEQKWAAGSKE